jgi:cell wall-associated NlpC family hydrolase
LGALPDFADMRLRRSSAAVLAAVCVTTTSAHLLPGHATPLDDARAEAARIEARLAEQGRRVSELDEQYNQARLAADESAAALVAAEDTLRASQHDLARARARLAREATQAYIHGGASPMLDQLIRAGREDFGVRRRYLETALTEADRALDGVRTAQQRMTRRREALETARDLRRDAANRLAADREAALEAVAAQQATLALVRGEVAHLVAEDEARLAAEAQTRARAAAADAARRSAGSRRAREPMPAPVVGPQPAAEGADVAVAEAIAQLGKPYEWAGAGPDTFDCSGLTQWAWRAAGVRLTHSAEYQFRETRRVDLTDLKPGDLLFFGDPIHHVGMYVGGDTMIEAPYTGAVVRYRSIWRADLAGAGRPA